MIEEGISRDEDPLRDIDDENDFQFAVGVRGKRKERGMQRETIDDYRPDCIDRAICYTCDGKRRCGSRVGNFTVLVETKTRTGDRKLWCVVGPYWKVMVFVTSPLIIVVPLVLMLNFTNVHHRVVTVIFPCLAILTVGLLWATACHDPGILRRRRSAPSHEKDWIWSDQTESFRPPGAKYCSECDCVIEGYDHVCPWTGTAIGRLNLYVFYGFVVSVTILMYFSCFFLIYGLVLST